MMVSFQALQDQLRRAEQTNYALRIHLQTNSNMGYPSQPPPPDVF